MKSDVKQKTQTLQQLIDELQKNGGEIPTDVYTKEEIDSLLAKTYLLDGGERITSGDLNSYNTIGNYFTSSGSSAFQNRPADADSSRGFRLTVMQDNPQNLCQIYDEFWTSRRWIRPCTASGIWQAWELVDENLALYEKKSTIGNLTNLKTSNKTSIVAAINELYDAINP